MRGVLIEHVVRDYIEIQKKNISEIGVCTRAISEIARLLELSVAYDTHTYHVRTLFPLTLYHHHVSSSITFTPHQVSFFVVS